MKISAGMKPFPAPSLDLIERCQLDPRDSILDIGAGSSTLFDHLIARGHQNLIAADISSHALERLKQRLDVRDSTKVEYFVDDITNPQHLNKLSDVKLWHDRALLHFLHDEAHMQAYLNTMNQVLAPEGFVIIAAFALYGAEKCTGLPVQRYSAEMLENFLGPEYTLLEQHDFIYHQPSGSERPFIYTRFRRSA